MADQATWEFINSFSGWVSGMGSLFAVVVALHLAGKDRRVKIEMSADIITVIGPMKNPEETIGIRLFNPNRRIVQVNLVCWISLLKKRGFLTQNFTGEPNLPVQLNDSDDVVFTIPIKYMRANLADLRPFLSPYPKLMVYFLRVVAVTSGGKKLKARIGPKLRTWILQNIQNGKSESDELSKKKGAEV